MPGDEVADEDSGTPQIRADGLRNRHRILVVARELFAQQSAAEVQLEDIAAAAGVGRATLFRHIQSKDALIEEIYRERIFDLQELAARAMTEPTGWDGFALLMRTTIQWMHEDRGLYDFSAKLYREAPEDPRYFLIAQALDQVIARAHREKSIRGDFALLDLLPLLGFTVAAPDGRIEYYTDVLLNGLRNDR